MKRLSTFVFICSFVVAQSVHAETPVVGGTPTYSQPAPSAGINKTAKQSSSTASVTMIANGVSAAGFLMAAKAATPADKPIWYAMAAATLAQAALMGGGAKNAGAIDKATGTFTPPAYDYPSMPIPEPTFNTGEPGGFTTFDEMDKEVRAAGYVMSEDGSSLKTPSGGSVSTAAIASGNAPGFEMTEDMKAQAAAIAEEAVKKASGAKVVAIGLQDAGGGGGGSDFGAAQAEGGSRFNMADYLKGLRNRDPSSVTGLSKKLGEDNIGIKSDNIFEMVSRQYKRKQGQRAFMN